jgi:G6PDH family F420-dependent oxidoreductase
MPKLGYKLMTETHGPNDLVRNARLAEDAGFDFVSISDHYHPWLKSHGHSPFAWSVLGAIAATTKDVGISTGLTCPILRYHPAIVAQAAATIGVMSEGRFTLALGAGERLNEHVVGQGWPPAAERQEMLLEAVEIIRLLWRGELTSYDGVYFNVENARLYDLPRAEIPIVIGIAGERGAQVAAEVGDGIMATEADAKLVRAWESAGGSGDRYGELAIGYAASAEEGLRLVHEYQRFGVLGWKVLTEIPNVGGFEEATRFVKPEDLQEEIPHGPDPEPYVEAVQKFVDAGFDHVVLLAVGREQEEFIRFFEESLAPLLRKMDRGGTVEAEVGPARSSRGARVS